MDLRGANLTGANLRGADLSGANLSRAVLIKADLSRACLYKTNFSDAELITADLTGSYGRVTNFSRAIMWNSLIRRVTYKNCWFIDTDLTGVDMVGGEFLGSRFDGAILECVQNAERATFSWWLSPMGLNKINLDPTPGWQRLDFSVTGDASFQENAARTKAEDKVTKGETIERVTMWDDGTFVGEAGDAIDYGKE